MKTINSIWMRNRYQHYSNKRTSHKCNIMEAAEEESGVQLIRGFFFSDIIPGVIPRKEIATVRMW